MNSHRYMRSIVKYNTEEERERELEKQYGEYWS